MATVLVFSPICSTIGISAKSSMNCGIYLVGYFNTNVLCVFGSRSALAKPMDTFLLLGFALPSNKYVTLIMLVYMWFVFAFNTSNGDYLNYVGIYTRIGNGYLWTISNYEVGYVAICKLSSGVLHLSYADFIILIATISTLLFVIVIKLWTDFQNQNTVISLFIIYTWSYKRWTI